MDGTIEQEFKITFKTDSGKVADFIRKEELDVELYEDQRFDHGSIWEVKDKEVERAISEYIDNADDILLEYANEYISDHTELGIHHDDLAVQILSVEVVND